MSQYSPKEHALLTKAKLDPKYAGKIMTSDSSKLSKDERRLKENLMPPLEARSVRARGGKKIFIGGF